MSKPWSWVEGGVCSATSERKIPVPVAMSAIPRDGVVSGVGIVGWIIQPRICEASLCWVVSLEIVRAVCGDRGVEVPFRLRSIAGKKVDSFHCC